MLSAALLCVAQLAVSVPDSTYSTIALSRLVATASQANRRVPQPLVGYDARIESEIALLVNTPTGPDGAVSGTAAATTESSPQIEQFQLNVSWNRLGTFRQRMVGYRARQLAPMVSALSMVPRPWTAPTLYGDRLSLVFGGSPSFRSADSTRRQAAAVHPFAQDREAFYRFSGGDTVLTIRTAARVIPVVQIDVEPRTLQRRVVVFAGQIFVDGSTGEIIRMRGRLQLVPSVGESAITRMARFVGQVHEVAYIDFENSQNDGRFWLPHRQRIEYQVVTALTEARATIRVQSVWRDMRLNLRAVDSVAAEDTVGAPNYSLELVSADSASQWDAWRYSLGALTTDASARDFDDVTLPQFRPDGPPQWRWQARGFTDVVRLNRVEGLFVGAAGLLDLRQAAPGVAVRVFGGWATTARTMKGGIEAARVDGFWIASMRAERQLASTNDFSQMLGGAGGNVIGALFGQEDHDWVDRRVLALGLTRELGARHASALRIEAANGSDRGFSRELTSGIISGRFRPNRPVSPGRYVRSRVQLDVNRNVVTSPLASGVGAVMSYERGDGALSWERGQVQALAQRMFGRVVLAARTDAAIARSANLPVQQLLEIGGGEGLPGFEYKEFAGDEAIVVRSTAGYMLPLWEAPIRLGHLILPAISPLLQVGVFAGRTSSSRQTVTVLNELGWVTSQGWQGSLDVRLRFLSGAISVGASRPLEGRNRWKVSIGVGGSL